MTAPQFVALLTHAPRVIVVALAVASLVWAFELGRWV